MAIEITNTLRSASIIRVHGTGTHTIELSNLSSNADESVSSASIKRMNWTTNGHITIARNITPIATLYNAGEFRGDEWGHSIANNSTSNVVITVTTGGTVFLELSKIASYANSLVGFM